MDRVFLDANVLFSAAWRTDGGLLRLWDLPHTTLLTSAYAAEEAVRNLDSDARRERLGQLLARVTIVPEARDRTPPPSLSLPAKDIPILLAALASGATHLLTGDIRHFGPLLDRRIGSMMIQLPRDYLLGL